MNTPNRSPESQIEQLGGQIKSDKKYFVVGGALMVAGGVVLDHLGVPNDMPNWFQTAFDYFDKGIAAMGVVVTGFGIHQVGFNEGRQAELRNAMPEPPEALAE